MIAEAGINLILGSKPKVIHEVEQPELSRVEVRRKVAIDDEARGRRDRKTPYGRQHARGAVEHIAIDVVRPPADRLDIPHGKDEAAVGLDSLLAHTVIIFAGVILPVPPPGELSIGGEEHGYTLILGNGLSRERQQEHREQDDRRDEGAFHEPSPCELRNLTSAGRARIAPRGRDRIPCQAHHGAAATLGSPGRPSRRSANTVRRYRPTVRDHLRRRHRATGGNMRKKTVRPPTLSKKTIRHRPLTCFSGFG